eukprot:12011720-Alexandrium_andersonii.AAC.1
MSRRLSNFRAVIDAVYGPCCLAFYGSHRVACSSQVRPPRPLPTSYHSPPSQCPQQAVGNLAS